LANSTAKSGGIGKMSYNNLTLTLNVLESVAIWPSLACASQARAMLVG